MAIETDDKGITDYLLPDEHVRPDDLFEPTGAPLLDDMTPFEWVELRDKVCPIAAFTIPANTLRAGDIIRIPIESVQRVGSVTFNGVRYLPEVPIRDTLPPVEIFDQVPALAVEVTSGGDTSWFVFWRNGDWIECSGPSWTILRENWSRAFLPCRCRPCEPGNIFAAVPWPEGI